MKKTALLLITGLIMGLTLHARVRLGFVAPEKPRSASGDIRAAWAFANQIEDAEVEYLSPKKLGKARRLDDFDVIWIHLTDTIKNPAEVFTGDQLENLRSWVEQGGGLLLTREAVWLLNAMGLESNRPQVVNKKAEDSGYGRMLGFHAFRSHPVFAGLNGGAYVLKPGSDLQVRNIGYYGDRIPANGKVVATDWDYIFLRENIKLVSEYQPGKGEVLAVGAYMYFDIPAKENAAPGKNYNVNRLHLEKFTKNCIAYLAGEDLGVAAHYWNFAPPTIEAFDADTLTYFPMMRPQKPAQPWELPSPPDELQRRFASDNFFDVAGQRLLLMGNEKGGLEEIWAHPFMAFRDYQVGIRFSYSDSIYWLNTQNPMIEVTPSAFTRQYRFKRAYLTEVITTSPDQPEAVIHYEYRGVYPADLFIRFNSNQRIMWPYSENVLGGIGYSFHRKLNAFILTDPSGDFVSMMGFNKEIRPFYLENKKGKTDETPFALGPFSRITARDSIWQATEADGILVGGMAKLHLEMNDNLDVIVAAGSEGTEKAISAYQQAKADPQRIITGALQYQDKLGGEVMHLQTPDSVFNLGYNWAVTGSDRFYVHTPGLGKSLTAGYATTASGWDGGQKISGRPGYAWYFGRDSEWSGMALLHYGDFEKVKGNLTLLQDFQDLNGKIFHELSTSGFVHYDASDATPLYVVLAGRYLKHSGDLDFIARSWEHLKAAMDFMYSTDTDGDGLIENTNVGHGWVEGGGLFGSHTSLYLASCWAAALDESAYMAGALGKTELAEKYSSDAGQVIATINKKYWDNQQKYFYHGMKKDGSFITEKTIMPTLPVFFGQVDPQRAREVTFDYAGNDFSSDWGVRIVGEQSPLFSPNGYHTGSVWPLYTGWTALAEYAARRPVQGFTHIMNNMLVYRYWALGFVEEVLNGETYKPSGVCRHQCWSETMVLQPMLEGMLGLAPDALNNKLIFRPAFPAGWNDVKVDNIRIGKHHLNFSQSRKGDRIIYHFSKNTDTPLDIEFSPQLPSGTQIVTKSIDGILQRQSPETANFRINLDHESEIILDIEKGISVLPLVPEPKPGYVSEGFRILNDRLEKNIYSIDLQARSGARETFSVYCNDRIPVKTEKAEMIRRDGDIYTFRVDFPEVDSRYANQRVKIFVE